MIILLFLFVTVHFVVMALNNLHFYIFSMLLLMCFLTISLWHMHSTPPVTELN